MTCVYIYLAGVAIVLVLILFLPWLRMDKTELVVSLLLSLFSWITVIIILRVLYEGWKEEREIMRNLPDDEEE